MRTASDKNRWSIIAHKKPPKRLECQNGTPDRIRTYDLWLRKPTLYPAELRVLVL